MKKFKKASGPFIKDEKKTRNMMKALMFALFPIILFSIFQNGVMPYISGYGTIWDMLRPIFMILLGVSTSFIIEFLWSRFVLKNKKKELKKFLSNSAFVFPGLFLVLIMPLNTPYFLIFLGAVFATLVAKLFFGGFGHNVFNPALVGSLFISSSYYAKITDNGGYFNLMQADTISTATPLTNLSANNFIAGSGGLMAQTAHLGGQIRHTEIRNGVALNNGTENGGENEGNAGQQEKDDD